MYDRILKRMQERIHFSRIRRCVLKGIEVKIARTCS